MRQDLVRTASASLLALTLLISAGSARSLPVIGDQTIVLLTSEPLLTDAGILMDPLGTADIAPDIVDRLEAVFPITGGDLSGLSGTIEHDGSGLLLSDGISELALENFLIDFDALQLLGDVSVDGTPSGNLPLFDIGLCTALAVTPDACIDGDGSILLDGFKLSLTDEAAAGLTQLFDLPDLAGVQFGVARIDVRFVPETSTAVLLLAGLALIAGYRRIAV